MLKGKCRGLIKQTIAENASTAIDQDKYAERFNALHDRYVALRNRYAEIERLHADRKAKRDKILGFIERAGHGRSSYRV